ncbi:MAG: ABC transporter ATP-binding protein [Aestuariibacter sp.]
MFNLQNLNLSVGKRCLLSELNLQIADNNFTAIMGENGCGKSTLVAAISGLYSQYSGELSFCGKAIDAYSEEELARRRALVNQFNQVNFAYHVEDVLYMSRYLHSETRHDSVALIELLCQWFDIAHLLGQNIQHLSGGERQRVFITKAVLQLISSISELSQPDCFKNKVLILDEPTSALDIRHQRAVLQRIQKLKRQGLTVICVSHDINLISRFADQFILLGNSPLGGGSLIKHGDKSDVLTAENIEKAFGYRPQIIYDSTGHPLISH